MKEYMTFTELINLLEEKGVKIKDKKRTFELLKKYSYYSIINTYKDIFKDGNNKYKNNVTFDEIYALYEFDKNIRAIYLKYILEIESNLKSLIAELISNKYGIRNYLIPENFDTKINISTINNTIDKINNEINKQYDKHEALTHYLKMYGFVPPFVLMKVITLGETSKLYIMLKQTDRQIISKYYKLSDKILKQIIQNITMVRNICAHNDRLYSFHSKFLISYKYIDSKYKLQCNSTNIYMIMKAMQFILDKKRAWKFENEINKEIKKLSRNLKSISINDILQIMGFPVNK